MRRDVASAAGIAIVPPRPADVRALLEDEEGIHPGFPKFDAHAEPRKTASDNEDVDDVFRCNRMRRGRFAHAWVIFTLPESAVAA